MAEADIRQLHMDIEGFMKAYRQHFPQASITPKMHILECHVVMWLRRWKVGSGLMGEQGAESLHAHIHTLEDRYRGVVNPLQRLLYVVKEQVLEASPRLNKLQPLPKRYKTE